MNLVGMSQEAHCNDPLSAMTLKQHTNLQNTAVRINEPICSLKQEITCHVQHDINHYLTHVNFDGFD